MCNVKRYADHFQSLTGLPLNENAPTWLINAWIGKYLFAHADVEFANHLHHTTRFSSIKAFSWQAHPTNSVSAVGDWIALREAVDGFVIDPFTGQRTDYRYCRLARELAGDKELIYFTGIEASNNFHYSLAEIKSLAATAYLCGADAVGFHANAGDRTPEEWRNEAYILEIFKQLPGFDAPSPILLVSTDTYDIYGDPPNANFLTYFDYMTLADVHLADLSKYKMVVFFTTNQLGSGNSAVSEGNPKMWDPTWIRQYQVGYPEMDEVALQNYVENGGLLVFIGGWDFGTERPSFTRSFFNTDKAHYNIGYDQQRDVTITLPEQSWFVTNFQMPANISYTTALLGKGIHKLPEWEGIVHEVMPGEFRAGFYYSQGTGGILIVPGFRILCNTPGCTNTGAEDNFVNWHRYLRDLISGMVRYHQKNELLPFFAPSGADHEILSATINLQDGGILQVITSDSIQEDNTVPLGVEGTDLFSGQSKTGYSASDGALLLVYPASSP